MKLGLAAPLPRKKAGEPALVEVTVKGDTIVFRKRGGWVYRRSMPDFADKTPAQVLGSVRDNLELTWEETRLCLVHLKDWGIARKLGLAEHCLPVERSPNEEDA